MKLDEQTKEIMTNEIDLKILRTLLTGEYSLTELTKIVGIAYKNLLPHIRKLEGTGWLKTEKDKGARGQVVMVSSTRYNANGKNWVDPRWRDLFRGKIGKKAEKEILDVIRELNKKATIEAVSYLTDIRVHGVWKNLLKGLLNGGYVQAKFEITKEGEKYLEELKKTDKSRF